MLSGKSPITVIVSCNRHRFSYPADDWTNISYFGDGPPWWYFTRLICSFKCWWDDDSGTQNQTVYNGVRNRPIYTFFRYVVPRCLELIERLIKIVHGIIIPLQHHKIRHFSYVYTNNVPEWVRRGNSKWLLRLVHTYYDRWFGWIF